MYKTHISAVVFAATLFAPTFVFAQSVSVTREEVKADLVQLEKAGYRPASDHTKYPMAIEAAEARIGQQSGDDTSYGSTSISNSETGYRINLTRESHNRGLYSGH